jgi:hypothetical protein
MTDMTISLFVWSVILLVVAPSSVYSDPHIGILCLCACCTWMTNVIVLFGYVYFSLPFTHATYMYSFGYLFSCKTKLRYCKIKKIVDLIKTKISLLVAEKISL